MGRKSLARERRSQILEAFETCIVERGLEGSSIAAIAATAGLDRTLVHHYFGSREALETALIERVEARYLQARDEAVAVRPAGNRTQAALDFLFSPTYGSSRFGVLFDELFAAANRSPTTKTVLLRCYEALEEAVNAEVEKAYPAAPASLRRQVSYSIVCLAETASRLARLGFPEANREAARRTAATLVRTLEDASRD